MKHTVKIGDRFKLGVWEWSVTIKGGTRFSATRKSSGGEEHSMVFLNEEADQLDWVKPEPTCSKEFAEALHKELVLMCNLNNEWASFTRRLKDFLDAHTEKEV